MKITTQAVSLLLTRQSLLELTPGAPVRVDVSKGELWITRDGDRNDYMVVAGQAMTLAGPQRTLIQAEADSTVRLTPAPQPPGPVTWRERIRARLEHTLDRLIALREAQVARDIALRRGIWPL